MKFLILLFAGSAFANDFPFLDIVKHDPAAHVLFTGVLKNERGVYHFDAKNTKKFGPAPYTCGAFEETPGGLHLSEPIYAAEYFWGDEKLWEEVKAQVPFATEKPMILKDVKASYYTSKLSLVKNGAVVRMAYDQTHFPDELRTLLYLDFVNGQIVRYEVRNYPLRLGWKVIQTVEPQRDLSLMLRDENGDTYTVEFICELDQIS